MTRIWLIYTDKLSVIIRLIRVLRVLFFFEVQSVMRPFHPAIQPISVFPLSLRS